MYLSYHRDLNATNDVYLLDAFWMVDGPKAEYNKLSTCPCVWKLCCSLSLCLSSKSLLHRPSSHDQPAGVADL